MVWRHLIHVFFAMLFASEASAQLGAADEHLEVRIVHRIVNESTVRVGVHFRIQPEWHIYWKNPGDSGSAPKFAWTPADAVSAPAWPLPQRFFVGDLVNLGYDDEVMILFDVNRARAPDTLALDLEWLVCKVECVPGFAKLQAGLGEPSTQDELELFEKFEALLPGPANEAPAVTLARAESEGLRLHIAEADVEIFPLDGTLLSAKPARLIDGDHLLAWADAKAADPTRADLLLAWRSPSGIRSAEISVDLTRAALSWSDLGFFFLALLGGLLLNLMPCVFPVLSIKVLSMVDAAGGDKGALRTTGWAYTVGVIGTFVALGATLLAVRAGGQQVGWGFQLQSPPIVAALALLFFALALNFLGLFELGEGLMNRAGKVSIKGSGRASSFWTGVLSVFIAAPCTGPFMGSALGAAVVLPAWAGLGIFAGLGLGMALPFLLLAYFPAWTRRLPRPGRWMETLRQFFAFPLFATVLWLLWVLQIQTSAETLINVLGALLAMAFLLWLRSKLTSKAGRLAALVGLLVIIAGALRWIGDTKPASANTAPSAKSAWAPYDAAAIAHAKSQGRSVFIDFTAAWCVTCQWNKKSVLDTQAIQDLFDINEVYLVRADWTDRNEEITKALAAHGRASVPLYLFEEPGKAVRVLPQLLTPAMIEELFKNQKEVPL